MYYLATQFSAQTVSKGYSQS